MKNFKNYLPILIGCLIIFGMIAFSFIYTYFIKDTLKPPPTFLYNDVGKMVGTYGYPPSLDFLFGVDRFGRDVFWMVVDGAKYTISIALVVGLLRVLIGVIFGSFFGFLNKKIRFVIDPIINAFRFVPAVIILLPFFRLLDIGFSQSKEKTIFLQLLLLIIIAIPILMNTIGEEVREFLKNDFITSSKIIGASMLWLQRKHVFPFLRTRLILLFVQQTVQTLFLLTQLGVFKLFIGGMVALYLDENVRRPMSKANEWSAMIGSNFFELSIDPWVIVGPSVAFIVTIFAFNLIKLGLEKIINQPSSIKKQNRSEFENKYDHLQDFDFVNKDNLDQVKREQDSYVLS